MNFHFIFLGLTKWLYEKELTSVQDIYLVDDKDFSTGKEVWILRTFKNLHFSALDISLSDKLDKNAINIVHRDDYSDNMTINNFVVCVRADKEPAFSAQVELLQNGMHADGISRFSLPHWPQGGIIPRDPNRKGIKRLSYFGRKCHISPELESERFKEFCRKHELVFDIQEQDWTNYHSTDVVIAFRKGFSFYLDCKPASKLINSWLAGVPSILNPEYGYIELASKTNDTIFVNSIDDLLVRLETLIESPELYNKIVLNGKIMAEAFSVEKTISKWVFLLMHIEKVCFPAWQKKNKLLKLFSYSFSVFRAKIWGQQVYQYPNTWQRNIKSYLRIFLSSPVLFIKHLTFTYQHRIKYFKK